jgi:hypothetical protein
MGKSKRLPAKKDKKICRCEHLFYTPSGKKITLFALVAHDERKPARITPRMDGIRAE